MHRETPQAYRFKSFRLDLGERKLSKGRTVIQLTPKAFDLLAVLVTNGGHLVDKDELLTKVWGDAFVEESNVARTVHTLRKALGEDEKRNKFIETIPTKGYRFVAEVRTEPEHEPLSSKSILPPEQTAAPPALPAGRSYLSLSLGALAICAAAFGTWAVLSNWRGPPTADTDPASKASSRAAGDVINGAGHSPAAYDLYVRGKVRAASENLDDTETAIQLLEEAVALDPDFAEAFAQLARAYNTKAFKYSSGEQRQQFHENAEVAIEKALALNPDLAEGHFARGLILWTNTKGFPHEQAIQSYKRSLSLDPNSDETHHQLSLVYSHIGLLDEARESVNKALEINPNNTLARFRSGVYMQYVGNFDEEISVLRSIPPDAVPMLVDRSLAEALIQRGRDEDANAIVEEHLASHPQDEGGSFTGVKALLLARAGKRSDAEDAIARAVEIGSGYGHFHHTAYNIASAYALLDQPDSAVDWLEKAANSGFPNYSYFTIDPNLDPIRQHPAFKRFMGKLRLRWEKFKALP